MGKTLKELKERLDYLVQESAAKDRMDGWHNEGINKEMAELKSHLLSVNLPGRSFYNKSNNLEYYHIPKNAMTSIRFHFGIDWTEYTEPLPLDRRVFCVLRNPVDRFISSFLYLSRPGYGGQTQPVRPMDKTSLDAIFKAPNMLDGFSKYLSEIEINGFFDNHHIPQSYYMDTDIMPGKRPISVRKPEFITHYIDFNDMDAGLSLVFGRDIKLPTQGATANHDKKFLKNNLTKQMVDKINKIYSDDTTLYNNIT